jgi:hypothetical protein
MKMTFTDVVSACPSSGSGVHSWIMSCANVAAKEGISAEDAAAQIRANMTRAEKPANEVANTIQKAYRETGRNYTNMHIMTAQERNSYREELQAIRFRNFARLSVGAVDVDALPAASPVAIHDNPAKQAVQLLAYLYGRKEIVWIGDQYDTFKGLATAEEWMQRFLNGEAIPPYIIPNPLTGKTALTKNEKESCRCDGAIEDFRYALFEVDLPGATLEQQAAFLMRFKDEMKIQSITYSGKKSLHALCRTDCKTEKEWDMQIRNGCFLKWIECGADPTCRNPSRLSRMPGHDREGGKMQRLLWLRGGAV